MYALDATWPSVAEGVFTVVIVTLEVDTIESVLYVPAAIIPLYDVVAPETGA